MINFLGGNVPGGGKKPVPLPRSKIPVPTKSATMDRAVHPELRTFKRSKTDLSLGMLNQYKANRAGSGGSGGSGGRRSFDNSSVGGMAGPIRSQDDNIRFSPQQHEMGGGTSTFLGSFSHNEFMAGGGVGGHHGRSPSQNLIARRGHQGGSSSRPSTIREADELSPTKPLKKADSKKSLDHPRKQSDGGISSFGSQNNNRRNSGDSNSQSHSQQQRRTSADKNSDQHMASASAQISSINSMQNQQRAKESPMKEQKQRSNETFRRNSIEQQNQKFPTPHISKQEDEKQQSAAKKPLKPLIKDKPNVNVKKTSTEKKPDLALLETSDRSRKQSEPREDQSSESGRKQSDSVLPKFELSDKFRPPLESTRTSIDDLDQFSSGIFVLLCVLNFHFYITYMIFSLVFKKEILVHYLVYF